VTARFDVLVAGAGIIGAAVAHELARRGTRVGLVDPRRPAAGATQASAGVLAPFIEGHRHPVLRALGARSLAAYDEFVARAARDSGLPVRYARSGTLEVAVDEAGEMRLAAEAALHGHQGVASELVDGSRARQFEPGLADDVCCALLVPGQGYVAAADLTAALVRAAVARGAVALPPAAVEAVTGAAGRVRVTTSRGAIEAGCAVLAAGSWAGQVSVGAGPALPVRPVRGQLLQLASPVPMISRVLWGADCYLVPGTDGEMLVGATVEEAGFDERATVAGVRDLLDDACALLPRAWNAGFTGVRVGLRPATPDELPVIGASATEPGVIYACGHYRNGILLAPLTAALIADLVLDGRSDPGLADVSPRRFGL
jgi:glycine oxidase